MRRVGLGPAALGPRPVCSFRLALRAPSHLDPDETRSGERARSSLTPQTGYRTPPSTQLLSAPPALRTTACLKCPAWLGRSKIREKQPTNSSKPKEVRH